MGILKKLTTTYGHDFDKNGKVIVVKESTPTGRAAAAIKNKVRIKK